VAEQWLAARVKRVLPKFISIEFTPNVAAATSLRWTAPAVVVGQPLWVLVHVPEYGLSSGNWAHILAVSLDGQEVVHIQPPPAPAPRVVQRISTVEREAIAACGLVDRIAEIAPDACTGWSALMSTYANRRRAAIAHGFAWFDWKPLNDSDDPAADLVALARPARGFHYPRPRDEDIAELGEIVPEINVKLARAGEPGRIWLWPTQEDCWCFVGGTAERFAPLLAARVELDMMWPYGREH
jgi:hypothetical protein